MLKFAKHLVPATTAEAHEMLLANRGARVLGGGLWLRQGRRAIACAIDLSACGLDYIEESDDAFAIGAMTPLSDLERHRAFNDAICGVFERAVRDIVGVQFRNLATVGGSLYGRFGFSDVLTALMALDAEVEFTGAGRIGLPDFAAMPYERDILERLVVHRRPYRAAYGCMRRQATDFPVVNVCAAWWGDAWHVAVGARPLRACLLTGDELGCTSEAPAREELERALEAVRALDYGTNYLAGAEYRRHIAGVLAVRAICEAAGIEVPPVLEERFEREARSLEGEGGPGSPIADDSMRAVAPAGADAARADAASESVSSRPAPFEEVAR